MKQNVIVTGGAGFIGSSLCKVLAQRNFNPVTVDNLSTGFRELVKFGDFVEADCGDYNKMIEVFKKYQPLAILHIAGSKSVEESTRDPHKYYENNVAKTNQLLKAAVDCGVKYFIFSSTAAIFGSESLTSEDAPKNPLNTYGMSKLMVEQVLESYDKSYGIKYAALRYFNVTGADPEAEVGEVTKTPANIFPILNEVATGKRKEFVIFGDDYNTTDGTCIRDYIHCFDLADAHVITLEKLIQNNQSFKVNLGNGRGFSVKQVVEVFKKITGVNFKVSIGKKREGDPSSLVANNKFANDYLGWKPKFTSLEDQARHSWNWYKKSQQHEEK